MRQTEILPSGETDTERDKGSWKVVVSAEEKDKEWGQGDKVLSGGEGLLSKEGLTEKVTFGQK